MTKNIVKQHVMDLSYELDGPIDNAIQKLKEVKKQYPNAEIYCESFGYPYDSNEYWALRIYISREETDEEYIKRITQEKQYKENRRLEYERLRKEFEGK